ncbi:MAG: DNA polymerase III subunit gamma/tau [Francisellaceae bacterium]
MSYQVLARKYRPKCFGEVSGQRHILNSLIHALDSKRLHHAYLFTGTRGVGKTSLARLLAKSLNCIEGVSSTPCLKCVNCISIEQGNFVDLIEIDAASRTKVEDTRDILDNVQYMPTQGRYKVYLIDEVHMLSTHSFNALLKTLEEPPEHVKFLLATTDPQKLPVTILSRCLQFHLKHLSETDIETQLSMILKQESIHHDGESLKLIAHHATGSMRDALSLTDQAIAYGNGMLKESDIIAMLGLVKFELIYRLIQLIIDKDAESLITLSAEILSSGKSATSVLDRLAETFYAASIFSLCQQKTIDDFSESQLTEITQKLPLEMLQLYYQLTIKAKEDVTLAPTETVGLNMALLRLIAFQSVDFGNTATTSNTTEYSTPSIHHEHQKTKKPKPHTGEVFIENRHKNNKSKTESVESWSEMIKHLNLRGAALQVVMNCHLISATSEHYILEPAAHVKSLITSNLKDKITQAFCLYLKKKITIDFSDKIKEQTASAPSSKPVRFEENQNNSNTPADIAHQQQQNKRAEINKEIKSNPDIIGLNTDFGFTLQQNSIQIIR